MIINWVLNVKSAESKYRFILISACFFITQHFVQEKEVILYKTCALEIQ